MLDLCYLGSREAHGSQLRQDQGFKGFIKSQMTQALWFEKL